jgi:TIR domain-containing protein
MLMSKPSIFISYSHKDEKWKDRLENQLAVLEQEGSYDIWTDHQIGAGQDWHDEIEKALQRASVAILLVSANSLTSEFILDREVADMLSRRDKEGLTVIPIIVSDCPWKKVKWLANMQVRPRDGRALQGMSAAQKARELTEIVSEIAMIIEDSSKHKRPNSGVTKPKQRTRRH